MIRKCPICKTENPGNAKFCSKCGAPLVPRKERADQYSAETTRASPWVGRVPSPGMCYYHQSVQAEYVCSRCGRSICRNCTQKIGGMIFCVNCAPVTRVKEFTVESIVPGVLVLALAAVVMFSKFLYGTPLEILFDLIVVLLLIVSAVGIIYSKKWAGGMSITVIIIHWFLMPLIVFPLIGIPLRYYSYAVFPLLLRIDVLLIFILRIGSLLSTFLAWPKFT